jgi:hypothetical protein
LPQNPSNAANNKPKLGRLQTTFIKLKNCDPLDRLFERLASLLATAVLQRLPERSDGIGTVIGYNWAMARGWESKSVEEQQAAATVQTEAKQRLTPQQAAQKQQKEAVELSRRLVRQQLQSAQNPRHRQMLESALADLDSQIARLG